MNEKRSAGRSHAISGAFVFLLLGVFAVFSAFMVLLGTQLYQETVEETASINDGRVLINYIANTVRGNDSANSVSVKSSEGTNMLVFAWAIDDEESYETRIYCHEGMLYEYFGRSEQPFDPKYGEPVCPAEAFVPVLENGMLTVSARTVSGEESVFHMALRCMQEVE